MQSALPPQQGSLTHQAVSLDALPVRTASAVEQLRGLVPHICFIEPFRDPGDRPAASSPYIYLFSGSDCTSPISILPLHFSHLDPDQGARTLLRAFPPRRLQAEPLLDFFDLNPAADTDILLQLLFHDPTAMSEKRSQKFAQAGWISCCFCAWPKSIIRKGFAPLTYSPRSLAQ